MGYLENSKTYTGSSLDTTFFRPMLCGPNAEDLGVRVLYNMPTPTTVQLWEGQTNVLKQYNASGWSGGEAATKTKKTIDLSKVKAEVGFAAADYFSMVYESIANIKGVPMDDLTGTDLESAETELFKKAIAESIRATMWLGDASKSDSYNTFNGFLKQVKALSVANTLKQITYKADEILAPVKSIEILEELWVNADNKLKDLKNQGKLAFFVTSDIYHLYEKYLDGKGVDAAYSELVNGRVALAYHGIPVVDIHISSYLAGATQYDQSFVLLTDRRNLVMAVNTTDFPGNEVRMWYNPDLMENRQRAVFMAGCDILDSNLLSYAHIV